MSILAGMLWDPQSYDEADTEPVSVPIPLSQQVLGSISAEPLLE